jgi:hypothetical protein
MADAAEVNPMSGCPEWCHDGYGPCPEWCPGDHEAGCAHFARLESVVLSDEEFSYGDHKATAEVSLSVDFDGNPAVQFTDGGHSLMYRFNMSETARIHDALGRALTAAQSAEGRSHAPESHAREINRATEDDPTLVCLDCGDEVFVWSTPDVDRCWRCDERADAEAGVLR